ncbi:hypothetical protein RMATCC62417_08839 [Rhizopus microsporus]|nr:hypothetical protein RMATCC62417_08839 [Rhizopus microsporus]
MDEDELVNNHSLEMRPSYTWQPSEMLSELMHFEKSLFTTSPIKEQARKDMVEQYLGMKDNNYNPPNTMPDAARTMNAVQSKHDRSLKRLQYLAFRYCQKVYEPENALICNHRKRKRMLPNERKSRLACLGSDKKVICKSSECVERRNLGTRPSFFSWLMNRK